MDEKLDDKKIESLHKLLAVFDTERLTSKDFMEGFQKVVEHVKKTQDLTVGHLTAITKAVNTAAGTLAQGNHGQISALRDQLSASIEEQKKSLDQSHTEALSRLETAIAGIRNGNDADEDVIVGKVLAKIPPPAAPLIGEDFRNHLETLHGDERLDKSAIRGIDELEKKVNNHVIVPTNQGTGVADSTGHIGRFQYLKFPGSTIATQDDTATVTITAAGVTFYTDTVSGTVDGTNVTFTVPNTITAALALHLANSIYQPGVDFTTSGTTITMTVAPDVSLSGAPFWLLHT